MATLSAQFPTLLDVLQRMDERGAIREIVEILNQVNDINDYLPWIEGNELTGHTTSIRTGIPAPTWRKLYGYVQPVKSTTVNVRDTTGMLAQYSQIDKKLADLNGNRAAWRTSEDRPIIEGIDQEFMQTLFYGNEGTEPEAFTGLSPRYNTLLTANAQNADNVIGASGTTNLTSIWLGVFGEGTGHCIYPQGSKAGLNMQDLGEQMLTDANGAHMQALVVYYTRDCGFSLRDWRYFVRICNIDTNALTVTHATGANLIDLMVQALELPPSLNYGRAVFMCNRKIRGWLRRQMIENIKASTLSWEMEAGKRVLSLDGVPIVRCDALVNNETQVV